MRYLQPVSSSGKPFEVVARKQLLMLRRALVLAAALAALAVPGRADAADGHLAATVGPGFTIHLMNIDTGEAVIHLDPGTYVITVKDQSEEHDFHLQGPGVDMFTEVEFVGTVTWTVTLKDGKYTYKCDPHASVMHGAFTVGTPLATAPPPATKPPVATAKKLLATVGPGLTISLRDSMGMKITSLRAGAYTIVVRDRGRTHNFHLAGAGVNRKTTIAFMGTATWKVKLTKGTLRFVCDAHAARMHGSVKVV